MKKLDRIAQAVSAILIAGACLGAGSWLGDREDDSLLDLRGGDPALKKVFEYDCGDINLVEDEVGWLNCPREGEICVQCPSSLTRTFEATSSPSFQGPGILLEEMQWCGGDKVIGYCIDTVDGVLCYLGMNPPIIGECSGGVRSGLYQSELPPGAGD